MQIKARFYNRFFLTTLAHLIAIIGYLRPFKCTQYVALPLRVITIYANYLVYNILANIEEFIVYKCRFKQSKLFAWNRRRFLYKIFRKSHRTIENQLLGEVYSDNWWGKANKSFIKKFKRLLQKCLLPVLNKLCVKNSVCILLSTYVKKEYQNRFQRMRCQHASIKHDI